MPHSESFLPNQICSDSSYKWQKHVQQLYFYSQDLHFSPIDQRFLTLIINSAKPFLLEKYIHLLLLSPRSGWGAGPYPS